MSEDHLGPLLKVGKNQYVEADHPDALSLSAWLLDPTHHTPEVEEYFRDCYGLAQRYSHLDPLVLVTGLVKAFPLMSKTLLDMQANGTVSWVRSEGAHGRWSIFPSAGNRKSTDFSPALTLRVKIKAKTVEVAPDHLIWQGTMDRSGRPIISVAGRTRSVSRTMWLLNNPGQELTKGKDEQGEWQDRLVRAPECTLMDCVNPRHFVSRRVYISPEWIKRRTRDKARGKVDKSEKNLDHLFFNWALEHDKPADYLLQILEGARKRRQHNDVVQSTDDSGGGNGTDSPVPHPLT